jgi:hypothetical protein
METFQRIVKARRGSAERGRLILQYASEKCISPRAAWHRIYDLRDRLDPNGDLFKRPRKDKGKPRRYSADLIPVIKRRLRDREKAFSEIARELAVSGDFVRRVSLGDFD